MNNTPKQQSPSDAPRRLSRAERAHKKLHGRGPFKLKLGSRVFRYRTQAEYSAARERLSKGRFTGVGEMVNALQAMRTE